MHVLQVLDLSNNQLLGPLPFHWMMMGRLRFLTLERNRLSGSLPPEWSGLALLETMNLANNTFLNGTLPSSWQSLGTLNQLLLHRNSLTGSIPTEWNLLAENLKRLSLANNTNLRVTCVPGRVWDVARVAAPVGLQLDLQGTRVTAPTRCRDD
jgi:hypothetical protein